MFVLHTVVQAPGTAVGVVIPLSASLVAICFYAVFVVLKTDTMIKEVIRYSNEFVIRDGQVVYNPDVVGTKPADPEEVVSRTEEVAIHWTKGDAGIVQLSVQLDAEMVREQLRLYDKGEWLGEKNDGMLIFYTGDLKRYEIQKLVRNVRKARDDVYGADE